MADIGTVKLIASIDTGAYTKGASEIDRANKNIENSAESTSNSANKSFSNLAKVGIGALVTAAVAAGAAIASNIGNAVRRVDTLNNAPKVLENLGFSATESSQAIGMLDKGIKGLPTSLDAAASALTAIASASGLGAAEATDLTLAFNNMALAGGKGPAEASRALTQFTQVLGRGKFQMQDFNTLAEVMPAQLNQIAKTLLGPEANVRQLGTALSDGTLTLDQFNASVVDLDKNGTAGFASFSKQAIDATSGIGTGFGNMQTAITRGIAAIITAIGSENISTLITNVGKGFEFVLRSIANLVMFVSTTGKGFISWISQNSMLLTNLSIVIGTLLIPKLIAFGVSSTIAFGSFIAGAIAAGIQATLAGIRMAAAWVMALGPIGIIASAIVGLTALIVANWGTISRVAQQTWAAVSSFAMSSWATIVGIFSGVAGFFAGQFNAAAGAVRGAFGGITSFFQGIWNGISSIFGNIGSFFADIGRKAVQGLKDGLGNLASIGKFIIDGIINGITSAAGALYDKAAEIAKGITDKIKGALNIKSPSRIMRDEVGKMIGLGIAEGIGSSTQSAVNAATRTVGAITSAFDGVASASPINIGRAAASNIDGTTSRVENHIGQVTIASEVDGERWLRRLSGNQEDVSHGLVPVQTYM